MQKKTVSVIIPIYNAADHLTRCLDSVVSQTYDALEIILVDDGCNDASGLICDRYAEKDRRIKVFHQPNGGVSVARNAGLDAATGEYIGWVDSDDWVEPQMLEVMLTEAMKENADIVICSREERFSDQRLFRGWKQPELLNKEDALGLLVEDDLVKSYLWDKLWRRQLFDGVRFPEIKVFEDMAAMCSLFQKAEKVACLPNILYHYEHRERSLSAAPSLGSRMDFYKVSKRRYEELKDDFPQIAGRMEITMASAAVHLWAMYYNIPKQERECYIPQMREVAADSRKWYQTALQKRRLGIAGRVVLRLTPYPTWWAFTLARWIGKLYKGKYGRSL